MSESKAKQTFPQQLSFWLSRQRRTFYLPTFAWRRVNFPLPFFLPPYVNPSGTDQLLTSLTEQYDIRKVACYKGVNIVPDVFKYIVLIEFVIDVEAGQSDLYALDCMQKFRIRRMSGYAACYTDFHSADIDRAMEDTGEMGAIIETLS